MTHERDKNKRHKDEHGNHNRSSMDGNQGEGNRGAARAYNEDTKEFAQSGRVREQAQKARDDLEGPRGDELRQAEKEGRSRAREEDPALRKG